MACTEFPCDDHGNPDLCGQDAQYPETARTFTCRDVDGNAKACSMDNAVPGDVVHDPLTGLTWQRVLPDTYGAPCQQSAGCDWQQAALYCQRLNNQKSDEAWRLPSSVELESLVEFGRSFPAIDPRAFPNTATTYFWSSSEYVGVALPIHLAWMINFGFSSTMAGFTDDLWPVRCVRGEPADERAFASRGGIEKGDARLDTTLSYTDEHTGLSWQVEGAMEKTWSAALEYCETSILLGVADWRLPNVNELKTLLDRSVYHPASMLPDMASGGTWSATASDALPGNAWFVDFYDGLVSDGNMSNPLNALCVRNTG